MATSTTNDNYLQQIADARAKLTQCFKEAHEQLTERETVLLRKLDKIREEYETDSKRQAEELKGLQAAKEYNAKNIIHDKTLATTHIAIDLRIQELLQTAGSRKISFQWDDDLNRVIQHLGQFKINDQSTSHLLCTFTPGVESLIPDYKSKCHPVITCCKKYSDAKAPGENIQP